MKWGITVLAIALLIALVWVSGCANVSLGSTQVGDFGKSADAQKAQDWFLSKYGNPADYKGEPRFLEPMVSSGIADNTPTDKILKFSDKTLSVYFWVIYEGFKKGDSVTATWTFQGKQFATLSTPVGGNYGAINAQFDKPTSGWVLGTHTITITGDNAKNSVTFDIIAGDTVTAPLPFDETRTSAGSQDLGLARQGAAGAVVPASDAKTVRDLPNQGPAATMAPASVSKPDQKLEKQAQTGVVVPASAQGRVSDVSAQNLASLCGPDQTMTKGICTCIEGYKAACGPDCVNLLTDPGNCGDCGITCGPDQKCNGGKCECAGGKTLCGDKCLDLTADANNCGSCGWTCTSKYSILGDSNTWGDLIMPGSCVNGKCYCSYGGQVCNNKCVSLQNDLNNCGSCGHACPVGVTWVVTCVDGICKG